MRERGGVALADRRAHPAGQLRRKGAFSMSIRAGRILAALLVMSGGQSIASDSFVRIRVKQDGQMCEVLNQITECASVAGVLSQEFGDDRDIPLLISPEGCGESAIGQIRVVANKLKSDGYLRVAIVGFLSEPNTKCTPTPPI